MHTYNPRAVRSEMGEEDSGTCWLPEQLNVLLLLEEVPTGASEQELQNVRQDPDGRADTIDG